MVWLPDPALMTTSYDSDESRPGRWCVPEAGCSYRMALPAGGAAEKR
jgi:hypothetical protein